MMGKQVIRNVLKLTSEYHVIVKDNNDRKGVTPKPA